MVGGFARWERWGTVVAGLAILSLVLFVWRAAPAAAADIGWSAPSAPIDLFDAAERGERGIDGFPKWRAALDRHAAERRGEESGCAGSECRLGTWRELLARLDGGGRRTQLEAVNAAINRIGYRSDAAGYGAVDYWATPAEFFARGGDCEDYAIAKYLALRGLGWRSEDLRLAVVLDRRTRQPHAVLVARLDGTAYVLDNLSRDVADQRAIRHYAAIFALNEHAWFHYRDAPIYAALPARGAAALKR